MEDLEARVESGWGFDEEVQWAVCGSELNQVLSYQTVKIQL